MRNHFEKNVQNDILRAFGTRPDMRLWRMNTGAAKFRDKRDPTKKRKVAFGVPGQADLTGILPDGRRLEIEVKAPNGTQSPEQEDYEAMIKRFNGVYILARSVADVADRLRVEGYSVD